MTRAVAILTLLALLVVGAAAPVAAREPAPETETPAEQTDAGDEQRAKLVEAVIASAESYLGLPYRIGREGPDIFDCSGLMYRIFADTGQVERIGNARLRAAGYMRWFGARGGFVKDPAVAERGDLVMYDDGSHIGIYLGKNKVISALVSGVTLHDLDGLTLDVSGILKVDWSGPGGKPLPHPLATTPPAPGDDVETPASLIAPLPWLAPLPDAAPDGVTPLGTERTDMRTATSRTFESEDGTFTTEIYGSPIFYLPPDSDEWQPIDLRFAAGDEGALVAAGSPVTVELASADARDGFLRVAAGDTSLSLGVPRAARPRQAAPAVLGEDGRFADYATVLRGDVGLRVFARPDGVKAFLVLPERPRNTQISFSLTGDRVTLAPQADGSVLLLQAPPEPADEAQGAEAGETEPAEPVVIGRVPRPLLLDSSDETGDGRAVRAAGAALSVTENDAQQLLTISLDESMLSRAEYPIYVDLSITGFPSSAVSGAHTFASSRYPAAALHGYQRPEAPAHPELWHGRLPGTVHYNEAYLRFPTLAETLGAPSIESAALRFYPYWQYDLDGLRPTWVSRVAQEWDPLTLTWDLRPTVDAELGRFETRAGQWSDIDITAHVTDVLTGTLADYGFRLHADGGGRGSWKRIVSDAGTAEALPPRLLVTWRGLRPVALDGTNEDAGTTLSWRHPALAPRATRVQLQLSTDGFATTIAGQKLRGEAASATEWLVPAKVLRPGVEYAWRVRARYGKGEPWSEWSQGALSMSGTVVVGTLPLE